MDVSSSVIDNMLATVMSMTPPPKDVEVVRRAVSDPIVRHMNLSNPEFDLLEDYFVAWQMYQTLSPLKHPFPSDPGSQCPIRVQWVRQHAATFEERMHQFTQIQLIMLGSLLSWGMLRFPCDMNTENVKRRISQLIGGRYDLFHTEIPLM